MKKLVIIIVVSFTALSISARALLGGERPQQPYEWVRTLEEVQDQIGRGEEAAHVYMPKLLTKIAHEMGGLEPKELLEPRNIRAIIAFTMSGGDGTTLRRVLGLGTLPPLESQIAKGALAYSEGKYSEAAGHFKDVDARQLDASLAGRVALIQAILAYKRDIKASIALLNLARLLGTGTLVEEAAIRRQAVLEAANRDRDRFEMLAFQYFRRFGKSVYADYFKMQFSVAAAGLDYSDEKQRFEKLTAIVESLDAEQRAGLYVMLAESAVLLGNLALTRFAANAGVGSSKPDTIERVRSTLYEASANVVGTDTVKALNTLERVPIERLNAIDVDLQRAALSVGRQIVQKVDEKIVSTSPEFLEMPPAKAEGPQLTAPGVASGQPPGPAKDKTIEKARLTMAKADEALKFKK